jgi:hypothetical protein
LAAEPGWREAVEVMPDLVANREIMTTHQINIDVEPAQIVWGKRELSVDERRDHLKGVVKMRFKKIVDAEVLKQTDFFPETQYDPAVVESARIAFEQQTQLLNAAATHEEIDALVAEIKR